MTATIPPNALATGIELETSDQLLRICERTGRLVSLRLASGTVQPGAARITGIGFTPESVARWNGDTRPTTHVDNKTLDVALTKEDLSKAGRNTVSVRDSGSGLISNPIDVENADAPVIRSIGNAAIAGPASKAAIAACPAHSNISLSAGMIATVRGLNLSPITTRVSASSSCLRHASLNFIPFSNSSRARSRGRSPPSMSLTIASTIWIVPEAGA